MSTLVIGGSGNVGRELIPRLLARGHDVSMLTRNPARAAAVPEPVRSRVADLDDPGSLPPAFAGVERVFLLVAQSPSEASQGLNALAAARGAGVGRLVYLSVAMPPYAPEVPHFATKMRIEQALRASDIPYTILRPNNFFQNDLFFREALLHAGVYPQPLGAVGVSRVDVRDIADLAAIALSDPGHAGATYALDGPDVLTGDSIAVTYAAALGRPVRYCGDDLDAWAAAAAQTLPPWLVADLRVMFDRFQRFGLIAHADDRRRQEQLLGRPPRSFGAYAAEQAHAWLGVGAPP